MILRVHNGWKILGRPQVYATRDEARRALSSAVLSFAATLALLGCSSCRGRGRTPDIAGPCPPPVVIAPVQSIVLRDGAIVGYTLTLEQQ